MYTINKNKNFSKVYEYSDTIFFLFDFIALYDSI